MKSFHPGLNRYLVFADPNLYRDFEGTMQTDITQAHFFHSPYEYGYELEEGQRVIEANISILLGSHVHIDRNES